MYCAFPPLVLPEFRDCALSFFFLSPHISSSLGLSFPFLPFYHQQHRKWLRSTTLLQIERREKGPQRGGGERGRISFENERTSANANQKDHINLPEFSSLLFFFFFFSFFFLRRGGTRIGICRFGKSGYEISANFFPETNRCFLQMRSKPFKRCMEREKYSSSPHPQEKN